MQEIAPLVAQTRLRQTPADVHIPRAWDAACEERLGVRRGSVLLAVEPLCRVENDQVFVPTGALPNTLLPVIIGMGGGGGYSVTLGGDGLEEYLLSRDLTTRPSVGLSQTDAFERICQANALVRDMLRGCPADKLLSWSELYGLPITVEAGVPLQEIAEASVLVQGANGGLINRFDGPAVRPSGARPASRCILLANVRA